MSDPTHSVEGPPPLQHEVAQLAQFRRFIDIGLLVNAVFFAMSLTGAILWRDPAMAIGTVVLVLFGRGRVSDVMGEFGKGIKSFKSGMADETTDRPVTPPPAQINAPPPTDTGATPVASEKVKSPTDSGVT